jgi:hypothetical protein
MPRRAPTQVIEHRISLSDFERKEFKQTVDTIQLRQSLDSAGKFLVGASAVAVVGTTAFFTLKAYSWVKDIPKDLGEAVAGAGKSLKENVNKHEGNVLAGTANWIFDGITGLF